MEKVLCDSFGNLAGELCSLSQLNDSYASIPRLSCDQKGWTIPSRVKSSFGSITVKRLAACQSLPPRVSNGFGFGMIGLALVTAVLGPAQCKALDCGESGEPCLYIAK